MFHYNKQKDVILNWDGVNFPTGNRDIDRFEKNINLASIIFFEPDDCLNANRILLQLHSGTQNTNAKYEIYLFKVYDEDNHYHYVLVKKRK